MEKQYCLAEMQTLYFSAVFRMLNQNSHNACTAVVKSECTSPALVKDLRKRVAKLPVKPQNQKYLIQYSGVPETYVASVKGPKVYSERVWGLKIGQNVMFDTEKYSLQDLMTMALNVPMAKIYSDYSVNYYSNGKREYCREQPVTLVNQFRRPPLTGWSQISYERAYELFPKIIQSYSKELKNYGKCFLVDPEIKNLVLAVDEDSDVFLPFNCILQGNVIESKPPFTLTGNMKSVFAAFSKVLENGQYDVLAQSEDYFTVEEVTYVAQNPSVTKIKLMVGFADLPCDSARKLVSREDLPLLEQQVSNGIRRFSLTSQGKLLDSSKVRTSVFFKDRGNEQIILAPQEVFRRWGNSFPAEFTAKLQQTKKNYFSLGNKFLTNIAGSPQTVSAEDKALQRLLAMPAAGFKKISGVDIAEIGADILSGKYSMVEICHKYNQIAELIEDVKITEYSTDYGAHYSSPVRHRCVTGAYTGRVYEDRII